MFRLSSLVLIQHMIASSIPCVWSRLTGRRQCCILLKAHSTSKNVAYVIIFASRAPSILVTKWCRAELVDFPLILYCLLIFMDLALVVHILYRSRVLSIILKRVGDIRLMGDCHFYNLCLVWGQTRLGFRTLFFRNVSWPY